MPEAVETPAPAKTTTFLILSLARSFPTVSIVG
jgi:hypothetical protein